MRRVLAAVAATLLALAAGCDDATRLEVTVTPARALDAGVLAAVVKLEVDVSGDETALHDYPVTIPLRTQRFVYHPLGSSKKLLVHVTALDIMGVRRAAGQAEVSVHGSAVPVSITLDYTTPVTVTPERAAIPAGGTLQLTANVPVHWSVVEPDGGSIDAFGYYRAPPQGGVHHVVATSAADIGAKATVAITGEVLQLLAGQLGGGSGMADGTGNAARFLLPSAITNDNHGNLFVGDSCSLRRVPILTGAVTTVAGGPCGTSVDGPAADARFGWIITGVAADSAGNVYILDSNRGHTVLRKLTAATNRISTVAGGGTQGADGQGAAAGFMFSQSLVVHPDGNLYVADLCALRRVTPDGSVSTVVGSADDCQVLDGAVAADARFANIYSVALDPTNGDFYAGDDNTIRRIAYPSFAVSTIAGVEGMPGNTDGVGTAARFIAPTGVAFDDNHVLYVVDTESNLVRRISLPDHGVTTFAGGIAGRIDGVGTAGQLAAPWALAWDAVTASLYVSEATNDDVRQIPVATRRVTAFVGNAGNYGYSDGIGPQASFWSPVAVAEGAPGTLYVVDTLNTIIRQIDEKTGRVDTIAGLPLQLGTADGTGSLARFGLGAAIAADRTGNVYIGDASRVRLLDARTHVVTTLAGGDPGCAPGIGANAHFDYIMGAAIGDGHRVYLADRDCRTIDRLDLDSGQVTVVVGAAGKTGLVDGAGAVARTTSLWGLAFDGSHTLYFADSTAVRKYDISTDQVTTIAGSSTGGAADGIGAGALFTQVSGIAYDGRGTLYVSDSDTIRTIDIATNAVRTWAGVKLPYSQNQLGPLPAILNAPTGMVYTADGSLVFADYQENAILIVPGPL